MRRRSPAMPGVDVEELRADNDELRRQNAELEAKAGEVEGTLRELEACMWQPKPGHESDAAAERAPD